ncbi:MAG: proteasome subunit alpha [Deltaproteobacteria bacterium]|nr:proteasome subunit alpha [Deltaproteobacteria bacterium]
MGTPFYVSPEQMYQDRAEYARKGIAKGRPIVAIDNAEGIVIMAENRSAGLRKIAEIYDCIAFSAVGKFDEYENLRKHGVRAADLRGFSFSREDVVAANLANDYSTLLGTIFTREMKPYEVEILVCEVNPERNSYFQILYDGTITDRRHYASVGGDSDEIHKVLQERWKEGMSLAEAVQLARDALTRSNNGSGTLDEECLEVAVLDSRRDGRKFRRLVRDEVRGLLGA